MSFKALFGYAHEDENLAKYLSLPSFGALNVNLDEPYTQWASPLVVQQRSDCVERSTTSRMRARIVMSRQPEMRVSLGMPDLPSARWGYWQYLESKNMLGTDPGTQPWDLIELLNQRGWCGERWMPYLNPDGSLPPVDETAAPPPEAFQHAYDQRGELRAHLVGDKDTELKLALRHDLGVLLPFACDQRFVSNGGIPNDPDYVWDFDESSSVAGWHMIQVEGVHPTKGLYCPNTWDTTFGFNGYVWIGWKTIRNSNRCGQPIALDWADQTSDELAAAFAAKGL